MCVSHFALFLKEFLAISRSYSVCVSFSMFFSFLTIFQLIQCIGLIFTFFQCFLPYSTHKMCVSHFAWFSVFHQHIPVPTMWVSLFPRFFSFLAIFQVLHSVCLIFHVFQFSRHIIGPTVYIYHFKMFFSVSCHIPDYTVFVSLYFSSFLAKIQVLKCVFFIFLDFHCFSPYSRS